MKVPIAVLVSGVAGFGLGLLHSGSTVVAVVSGIASAVVIGILLAALRGRSNF